MQKIKTLTLAVSIILSFNVFGDMHKCVVKGKISYTEKNCPDAKNEKAITKGTTSALDTSVIRQQIEEDEIKHQKELALQQALLEQQQVLQRQQSLQQSHKPASSPEIEKAKMQAIKDIQAAKGNDAASIMKAKIAQKLLDSLMGTKSQPEPEQSPPQYVPSINQWCQTVDGVTNCWK